MKRLLLLLLLSSWLPACALFQRPPRPVHASPQEAASFVWPEILPDKRHQVLSGITVAAIQLAMEDFLPWDLKPHAGATLREKCLYERTSYDVIVTDGGEALLYVSIYPRPGVCEMGGQPIMDMGAVYAIDTRGWRILSVQH